MQQGRKKWCCSTFILIREYFGACFVCVELEDSDNKVECVWLGIRGKANQTDMLVGGCYRPYNQDKLYSKWLADVSK